MPKKELNNPNKPAVKTLKLKTKQGDSVAVQFKREPGGKKTTYFDYTDTPQLTKTGEVRKDKKETVVMSPRLGGGDVQKSKARIRKNNDTADHVRNEKSAIEGRKKAQQQQKKKK